MYICIDMSVKLVKNLLQNRLSIMLFFCCMGKTIFLPHPALKVDGVHSPADVAGDWSF